MKLYYDNQGNVFKDEKPNTYIVHFCDSDYLLNTLMRCGAQWTSPCGTGTYIAKLNGKDFYFSHDGQPLEAVVSDCYVKVSTYTADTKISFEEFCKLIF